MRLLLDECLPFRLRPLVAGHDVSTVAYMGRKGVRNGSVLAQAAAAGFDALITSDGSMECQQNIATMPLAVVRTGTSIAGAIGLSLSRYSGGGQGGGLFGGNDLLNLRRLRPEHRGREKIPIR